MPSLRIDEVNKRPGGAVFVRSGKHGRLFTSLADMREFGEGAGLSREELMRLAVREMLDRQPSLGNPAAFEGRTVTITVTVT
jgi:hypothetical protein